MIIKLWQGYRHFRNEGYSFIQSIQLSYDYKDYGNWEDDNLDEHWLCECGHYIEDGCHCSKCHREPPWGCPCGWCQDERYYEYEEDEFGTFYY